MNNKEICRSINNHKDDIFTFIGLLGIGCTAVSVGLTVPKAQHKIRVLTCEKQRELTSMEKVKASWKYYIPSALIGLTTAGCFLGACNVKDKRIALITAAYKVTEESFKNYKKAVQEVTTPEEKELITKQFIENQKQEVQKTMPAITDLSIIPGDGEQVFYEPLTGRYFRCNSTKIKEISNLMNKTLLSEGCVCYDMFEDEAKMPSSEIGYRWQWLYDDTQKMIEIDMSSATTLTLPNGSIIPVIIIGWVNEPIFQDRY